MDPCPFVRLIVESLALKLPSAAITPAGSAVHPTTTSCYAKLKINNFPSQTALLPISTSSANLPESSTSAAGFHLDPQTLRSLWSKPVVTLKISVFTGRMGRTCGVPYGKLLGSVQVSVNLDHSQTRACMHHNGWMKLGRGSGGYETVARLHMTVRSQPDPRFVFQFGGEPECSPVVFQIQGNIRQPVFSCKFTAERNNRSRPWWVISDGVCLHNWTVGPTNLAFLAINLILSLPSDFSTTKKGWIRTLSRDKDRVGRERKGWMIIVYDLSGSAVAAASMVTPFVPSPGHHRVSRSNPGAWLILRPNGVSISSWKPWGRLEAWRERGPVDGLGYKFELVTSNGLTGGVPIAEGAMSVRKGGHFCIDNSRKESFLSPIRGFVMESSVEGEGKVSKPVVQVGAKHVTCMADAALFVALSAAIDLSMDACRLFSKKLRKEFSHDEQELFP